jgi:hypothetical protein
MRRFHFNGTKKPINLQKCTLKSNFEGEEYHRIYETVRELAMLEFCQRVKKNFEG